MDKRDVTNYCIGSIKNSSTMREYHYSTDAWLRVDSISYGMENGYTDQRDRPVKHKKIGLNLVIPCSISTKLGLKSSNRRYRKRSDGNMRAQYVAVFEIR